MQVITGMAIAFDLNWSCRITNSAHLTQARKQRDPSKESCGGASRHLDGYFGHAMIAAFQTDQQFPVFRFGHFQQSEISMPSPSDQTSRVNSLIAQWVIYRAASAGPDLFCKLKDDLKAVRNPDWQGNPPISSWPPHLVDPDDGVNAAVEYYFLCRCWVASGKYPASQMRTMSIIYDTGKMIGATPRHNPNKPTTPITNLQIQAQARGIADGEADLRAAGKTATWNANLPNY
jgi:hypothetical protein